VIQGGHLDMTQLASMVDYLHRLPFFSIQKLTTNKETADATVPGHLGKEFPGY
jgi:hypothetical protein